MASSVPPSTLNFQVKLFKSRSCPNNWCMLDHVNHRFSSPTCSVKVTNAQYGEPRSVKLQLSIAKERLLEAVLEPVKDFPWRKAKDVLMKRFLSVGKKVFKWCFVAYFILSFLSAVILSISRSQELVIPFGLLVGCLVTDFLKEIMQEMLPAEEGKALKMPLVAISCFFVLVKAISAGFTARTQLFLLHVANGGLMQVLWLWRGLSKENHKGSETIADEGS
ncbi:hypothetical protein K2173_026552 [Erythroxylum novogranatense]|uniref:Uncharacterized protein n=1 Tax=Erythroxylum novogranatense TaxID=1862640 RepID=A0AAV8TZW5_9ROSI|nr:hypothetical protein K2173_026552 [Erythroxylum novogranatense]